MFDLIVKAKMPLIAVHTRDTLNAKRVLQHITGTEATLLPKDMMKLDTKRLYFQIAKGPQEFGGDLSKLYSELVLRESVLVLLNYKVTSDMVFNAGELPVPRDFLIEELQEGLPEKLVAEVLPVLGGLTVREAMELIKITQTRDGALSARGVLETRKAVVQPEQGISLVDTHQSVYMPDAELAKFVQQNKPFFVTEDMDWRLRPRGLLMAGLTGGGKTSGAKYIAASWGVPLFRLDASVQSKWVGESEANMAASLDQVAREAPCVMLIDEVEKLFSKNSEDSSSGVTTRMLSQLLWFLSEHREQVFTALTCNNKKGIPVELYRDGRIDDVIDFNGMNLAEALVLAEQVWASFGIKKMPFDRVAASLHHDYGAKSPSDKKKVGLSLVDGKDEGDRKSPAHIVKLVQERIKEFLLADMGSEG